MMKILKFNEAISGMELVGHMGPNYPDEKLHNTLSRSDTDILLGCDDNFYNYNDYQNLYNIYLKKGGKPVNNNTFNKKNLDKLIVLINQTNESMDNKLYGLIYLKVIGYHRSTLNISKEKLDNLSKITSLSNNINNKYNNDIIIKMDKQSIQPGCVTSANKVGEIAHEIYEGYINIFKNIIDEDCIRCVYTIGHIKSEYLNVNSLHQVMYSGNNDVVVKLGTYLDSSSDPGIYKI